MANVNHLCAEAGDVRKQTSTVLQVDRRQKSLEPVSFPLIVDDSSAPSHATSINKSERLLRQNSADVESHRHQSAFRPLRRPGLASTSAAQSSLPSSGDCLAKAALRPI
jgi:hypothetical protein